MFNLDFIDTTADFVLATIFAIAALLTIKVWFEKMAIERSGHRAKGGELWIYVVVISGLILAVINR